MLLYPITWALGWIIVDLATLGSPALNMVYLLPVPLAGVLAGGSADLSGTEGGCRWPRGGYPSCSHYHLLSG